MAKPTKIVFDGEHWFVDYQFHEAEDLWTHLSIPFDTEAEARAAERHIRCEVPLNRQGRPIDG